MGFYPSIYHCRNTNADNYNAFAEMRFSLDDGWPEITNLIHWGGLEQRDWTNSSNWGRPL